MSIKTNANLMKEWRRLARLDVRSAGRVLGISGRTVEGIEQGRRRAKDEVIRIALERLIEEAKPQSGEG